MLQLQIFIASVSVINTNIVAELKLQTFEDSPRRAV